MSKIIVTLNGEQFAITRPTREDINLLRDQLREQRQDETTSFLRGVLKSAEQLPPHARDAFVDRALDRAVKFSVVGLEEAIEYMSTIDGAARIVAMKLARLHPDRGFTYEKILDIVLSMSPAEQARVISMSGDGEPKSGVAVAAAATAALAEDATMY